MIIAVAADSPPINAAIVSHGDPAASGSDLVLVCAVRVKNPGPVLNDIDAENDVGEGRGNGRRDMAQRHGDAVGQIGEGHRRIVAVLNIETGPLDRPAVQTRRGACL